MSIIKCVLCGDEIDLSEDRYACKECQNYVVCSRCYEDEESEITHEHKLHRVRGTILPKRLYTYRDPRTGKSLILANCAGVLPGSEILHADKKESANKASGTAKAVLTLLDFGPICPKTDDLEDIEVVDSEEEEDDDDDGVDEIASGRASSLQKEEAMLSKYAYGNGTVRSSVQNGVVFHLVRLRDVSNPGMLDSGLLSRAAAEATVFITRALKYCGGDVVVHCYLGVRRSPTMFAAWLATQNLTVDTALRMIGTEHADVEKWDVEYKRLRPEWVEWLRWWRSNWKVVQESWIYNHPNEILGWNKMFAQVSGKEIVDEEINEIIEERKSEHKPVSFNEEDDEEGSGDESGSGSESEESGSGSEESEGESENEEDENESEDEDEDEDGDEPINDKIKTIGKTDTGKQNPSKAETVYEDQPQKPNSRRVIDDDSDDDGDDESNADDEKTENKKNEEEKAVPPPEKKVKSNITFKYTDGEPSKVQSSLMSFFAVKKK